MAAINENRTLLGQTNIYRLACQFLALLLLLSIKFYSHPSMIFYGVSSVALFLNYGLLLSFDC